MSHAAAAAALAETVRLIERLHAKQMDAMGADDRDRVNELEDALVLLEDDRQALSEYIVERALGVG